MAADRDGGDRVAAPPSWQDWQRWVEGVDWSDWRSWLQRVASTDWATGRWPATPWEPAARAGEVSLALRAWEEDEPGEAIRDHLTAIWPDVGPINIYAHMSREGGAMALQRQSDCSLSFYTGTYTISLNPSIAVTSTTAATQPATTSAASQPTSGFQCNCTKLVRSGIANMSGSAGSCPARSQNLQNWPPPPASVRSLRREPAWRAAKASVDSAAAQ